MFEVEGNPSGGRRRDHRREAYSCRVGHPPCERRLREPQFLRRFGEAQFFGDGDEVTQVMRFISRTIAEVIAISYRKCWGQEMAFSEGKGGGVRLRIALGYGAPTGEVLGETARLTDTHAGFETHARKALHSSDPH
jgi:hypothetical protein